MEKMGVHFIRNSHPTSFDKNAEGKIDIKYIQGNQEKHTTYDGVLLAIGRKASTHNLNLQAAGVRVNSSNGKIICDDTDQSNVPHIWAVGDVSDGRPELTPSAILAGELLAKRLFGGSNQKMNYDLIPTTVFTPLEYSCCGLSEEKALERLGEESTEVYHSYFTPLEWSFSLSRKETQGFLKVIVNKLDNERVVGIHYLGPNAGEVMQGLAVAMKAGVTKEVLDSTVGIHPTCAEEFTRLKVTKSSGKDAMKTGC
jgi:pyruvate/2-oxoglutarate dehydrogenase complex dihydrolipoamide dehydrogenase (E3) component